jgi:3-deoxy-D-manno-octulosonic-acid transferase
LPLLLCLPSQKFDIHLHASSVGEMKSLDFIIKNYISEKKNILITTSTLKSTVIVQEYDKKYVTHKFYPLDFLPFQIVFLWKYYAKKIILVDSEIWPNFFVVARLFNRKITIFNARISQKSRKMWNNFEELLKFLLKSIKLILPQSVDDKDFFNKFHENVQYFGNLKMINLQNSQANDCNAIIKKFCENKKIICIISTHEGEDEEIILQIIPFLQDFHLIYCPRHTNRSQYISNLLNKYQISNSLLSNFYDDKKCLVVNEVGLLNSVFSFANIVIMAGSFLPSLKGHNIMEPASFGCKIITGNYVETFKEIVDEMIEENAILQCDIGKLSEVISIAQENDELGLNAKMYISKNMPNKSEILNILD